MPDYRRYYISGHPYFITMVTNKRKPLLINFIHELREAFRIVKQHLPFKISAIVVLPDHCHFIMRLPDKDTNFSLRVNQLKGNFSRMIPKEKNIHKTGLLRRERTVWQRRFYDHVIRNEQDLQTHYDYIHYNPVKHGFVQSANEWPYSSFHKFVSQGFYESDWAHLSEPTHIVDLNVGE